MNDKKRLLWLSYSFVLICLLVTLFFFLHAQSRYLQYKTLLLNEINAVFLDSYAQLRNLYVAYNNVPFLPANELLIRNKQFTHIKFIPLPDADRQMLRAPDIFANLQQIKQNLDFITHNHLATLGLIQYARDYVIVTPYRPYHDMLFSRQADQALQQMTRIDPTWQQRPYDAGDFRGCRVYITTPYRENYSGLQLVSMLMPLYTEGKLQAVAIADIRAMIFRHIVANFNQQHDTRFFLTNANTADSFLIPCSQQRINIAYSKLSLLSASDLLIALLSASILVLLLAWVLRVKRKIYCDELTGLNNRYYVNDHLRRLPNGFSVLVLDVDNFKQVNDRYGHAMGDRVLQSIAQVLQNLTRDDDIVARWGGEEFLLLLMTDREDTVRHRAELIRRTIADESVRSGLPVTVSIGMCIARGQAFETAFKLADDCLYESKRNGKNQVTVSHLF